MAATIIPRPCTTMSKSELDQLITNILKSPSRNDCRTYQWNALAGCRYPKDECYLTNTNVPCCKPQSISIPTNTINNFLQKLFTSLNSWYNLLQIVHLYSQGFYSWDEIKGLYDSILKTYNPKELELDLKAELRNYISTELGPSQEPLPDLFNAVKQYATTLDNEIRRLNDEIEGANQDTFFSNISKSLHSIITFLNNVTLVYTSRQQEVKEQINREKRIKMEEEAKSAEFEQSIFGALETAGMRTSTETGETKGEPEEIPTTEHPFSTRNPNIIRHLEKRYGPVGIPLENACTKRPGYDLWSPTIYCAGKAAGSSGPYGIKVPRERVMIDGIPCCEPFRGRAITNTINFNKYPLLGYLGNLVQLYDNLISITELTNENPAYKNFVTENYITGIINSLKTELAKFNAPVIEAEIDKEDKKPITTEYAADLINLYDFVDRKLDFANQLLLLVNDHVPKPSVKRLEYKYYGAEPYKDYIPRLQVIANILARLLLIYKRNLDLLGRSIPTSEFKGSELGGEESVEPGEGGGIETKTKKSISGLPPPPITRKSVKRRREPKAEIDIKKLCKSTVPILPTSRRSIEEISRICNNIKATNIMNRSNLSESDKKEMIQKRLEIIAKANEELPVIISTSDRDGVCLRKIFNVCSRPETSDKKLQPITFGEHQLMIANHMIINRGLIAIHSPGSGKTLSAGLSIYCALENKNIGIDSALILAKGSNHDSWYSELEKLNFPSNYRIITQNQLKRRIPPIQPGEKVIWIITPDKFHSDYKACEKTVKLTEELKAGELKAGETKRGELKTGETKRGELKGGEGKILKPCDLGLKLCGNTFLIIDEVHLLKTEIKEATEKSEAKGKKIKAIIDCAKQAKRVLLLTGTPTPNEPFDIVNLIAMVDGTDAMTRSEFNKLYDNPDKTSLIKCLACKISYHKSDWRDTPPSQRIDYPTVESKEEVLPMTPGYQKIYDELVTKKIQELNREEKKESKRRERKALENPRIFYMGLRMASNDIGATSVIKGHSETKEANPKIDFIWNTVTRMKSATRSKYYPKTMIYSNFIKSGIAPIANRLDDEAGVAHVRIVTKKKRTKKKKSESKEEKKISKKDVEDEEEGVVRQNTGVNKETKRLYVEMTGSIPINERDLAVNRFNAIPEKQIVLYNNDDKTSRIENMDKVFAEEAKLGATEFQRKYTPYEPVQFILLSRTGREGLNLLNTRLEFIMEPDWNTSNTKQAENRGIRYQSHMELPPQERNVRIYYLLLDRVRGYGETCNPDRSEDLSAAKQNKEDAENLIRSCGIDMILKSLGKKKEKIIKDFEHYLEQASIEKNRNCIAGG